MAETADEQFSPDQEYMSLLKSNDKDKKPIQAVIITNLNVKENKLTKKEVENIFLGKQTKWENGKKITFFTLKSSNTHKAFLKEYIGKTSSQYKTFWKKQIFTGKGKAPKSFTSEKDLINYISSTKGAVGYISNKTASDSKLIRDSKTKKNKVKFITINR